MIIDTAKYTAPGGHEVNEDSILLLEDKGVFAVADGLGGHSSGEVASAAAVRYITENFSGNYDEKSIAELLEGANGYVAKNGAGGKTTIAAAFVHNDIFIPVNAGDSRVYYFRDGKIIFISKDHSVCRASVDMGMISFEEIRGNDDRSRLLKVLGGAEKLGAKCAAPITMQSGDAFLICSDGFWEYVLEGEMEADLLKSETPEKWLEYMLKRHILRAKNAGDNYSAVCGFIRGDEDKKVSTAPKGSLLLPLTLIFAAAAALGAGILLTNSNEPDATLGASADTAYASSEI
ncbi:MAG: PP2C family protein-serine/threonine phosphatase [Huintestinicola sp.]|uniref:PP2C family protein-serine/threonine phosphatase n=1 Tax=Huintestinicola sp. TaxID=2981661 RepID=UPI003F0067CE